MKLKLKFLVIFVLLSVTLSSFGGVNKDDLSKILPKEVLELQAKTGKTILVYCYTSWCKPCIKMSKEVFTNKKVKEYIDKNIIVYRVDMESDEGVKLNEMYNVTTYPTFLLFRDGVMFKKIIGAYSYDVFLAKLSEKIDTKKLSPTEKN